MRGKLVVSGIMGILVIAAIVVSLIVTGGAPASAQALVLDSTCYGLTSTVVVSIFNPTWNTNPAGVETVVLNPPVVMTNTAAGATTPTSTYNITLMAETGVNTAIFTANVVLGVNLTAIAANDTIKAVYGFSTVTATVANIVFKKDAATAENWFDIGQSPIVEVATTSTSSNVDTLTVKVASTADTIGINVIATETTTTSGIYRGSFKLVSNAVTPAAGELRASAFTGPGTGIDTITATLGKSTRTATSDDIPPLSNFTAPATDLTVTQTTIQGLARDDNSGLARVEVSTDNGATWVLVYLSTAYPTTPQPWSYAWVIPSDGTYDLKCRATDKVGNVETTAAWTVVLNMVQHVYASGENWIRVDVDSTPPVITDAACQPDILDAPMQPLVSATVTDATSGVQSVVVDASQLGVGAAMPMNLVIGTSNQWRTPAGTMTVASGLTAGTKTLTITATDRVGKVSTTTVVVTVTDDVTPPVISSAEVLYSGGGIAAQTGETVRVRVTATDDLTGVYDVMILNEADAGALFGITPISLTRVPGADTWQTGYMQVIASLPVDVNERTFTIRLQAKDYTLANVSAKMELGVKVVKGATVQGKVLLQGRTDHSGATVSLGTVTTTTDAEGNFSFFPLPTGSFALSASMPGFLPAQTPEFQVFAGETTTLPDVTLLAGDFTGDGIIDIYDLVQIAVNFNQSGPTQWPTQ